jgi:hypothetical protein
MCSFTLIPSLKKTLFPIARLPTVCEVIFSFRGAEDVTLSKSDAYVFSAKDWASFLAPWRMRNNATIRFGAIVLHKFTSIGRYSRHLGSPANSTITALGLFSHFIELVFYRETEVHIMVSDLSGSAWALAWTWE